MIKQEENVIESPPDQQKSVCHTDHLFKKGLKSAVEITYWKNTDHKKKTEKIKYK